MLGLISFIDLIKEKIVIFDGAMGTNIQALNLTPDDYGGENYFGCNEFLVITRPAVIEKIHADFLSVGCDVIETNTFGANAIVLREYNLSDKAYELNYKAAMIAKRAVNDYFSESHPRFVAGSIGPTNKLPSLGHIAFKDLRNAYLTQAKGLIEGGVDLLIIETCQDLLQIKAALSGIFDAMSHLMKKLPVVVSVTIESNATMLLGTDIAAVLTTLQPFPITALGINCATGPDEMSEHIRYLSSNSEFPILCMPNAGIPENINGKIVYKLSPQDFSKTLKHFVEDFGVNLVGGCCGTTSDHIKELVSSLKNSSPKVREWKFIPSVSSSFLSVPLKIDIPPLLVGEQMNANGSKQFRELLLKNNFDGMIELAKKQVNDGAHILDVSVAYVGRKEIDDLTELVKRYNTQITAPIMIDSTNLEAIEAALQNYGGKAIINSTNLEDGEEKFVSMVELAIKYGAAIIMLTIDEKGMAKTAAKKLSIAQRMYNLAVRRSGLKPENIIFDTLTFTLSSGDEDLRRSAIETLEGIKLIKSNIPDVRTSLGISNISFGFNEYARTILNSVFLYYAVEAGLDIAIVNVSKIIPLFKISAEDVEVCRKLIYDERTENYDPLKSFIQKFSNKTLEMTEYARPTQSIEERLINNILEGNKLTLIEDLNEALKKYEPIEIINNILLDGMKKVGELFGSGKMQLPFVLQSAEVMKMAVGHLEKFMAKSDVKQKGTMVLATVKGDVHDIGKNLVDIILSNNGYRIINLGIRVPIEAIIKASEEHKADAIGMSGLLVKSTLIMKENLEILNERGLTIPVVLGGAALTKRYVDEDLKKIYKGYVAYANDAFDGLRFMEEILANKINSNLVKVDNSKKNPQTLHSQNRKLNYIDIPNPPFLGSKVVTDISLQDVFMYLNETALVKGQWQVYKGDKTKEEYQKILNEQIYPELNRLKKQCIDDKLLQPKVVYGYYLCNSFENQLIIYKVPDEFIDLKSLRKDDLLEWLRFDFPRQKSDKYLCISDFFAPIGSGIVDVCAFQIVTVGDEASNYSKYLFETNNYREYLFFHGLSVEVTEALAEMWHKMIRTELLINDKDADDIKKLFSKHYRGARYSFGYPACPNLEEQKKIFELLKPERIGISLTEEYQLIPEQSTSAIIVHHPEARYFNI